MKNTRMKTSVTALTIAALALALSLTFDLTGRRAASAQTNTTASLTLPNASIYALNNDNTIFVMKPGTTSFTRLARVNRVEGNLIGIDFRPADGNANAIYGLTDTGKLYTISVTGTTTGAATLVSTLSPRFAGGVQSLMDFNPVVNALRLIGTNDQNFALVNSGGGNLNVTAVQTAMSYDPADVNKGVNPNNTGGSYTNNFAGATSTIYYGLDYDLDTLVTISSKSQTGSSNTGGGVLQTIGGIVDQNGAPINITSTADLDIYTDANGGNTIIGMSGRTMFTIPVSQINPNLALGATQKVQAQAVTMFEPGGGYIDIAVAPNFGAPSVTPTPTPTATPTPTPASLQAEKAQLGGGNKVATVHAGFTGTGFVDYADNVANGFTQFSLTQTGARTFTFRYANGSTVNRPCVLTLNGANVGMLSFPPTGAWTTWKTVTIQVNLGSATSAKAARLTSTTAAGGPNLDRLDVQ
jgi:Domain of unknown function (DUF4394)/Carbohydrate binding module (family 6)